jgi:hypothetical protein
MRGTWLHRPWPRLALIAGGLMLALSGCHLHHGDLHGAYGYHGAGPGAGYERGHHHGRYGHHRHGGWHGRY